jgi:hypothetical protein
MTHRARDISLCFQCFQALSSPNLTMGMRGISAGKSGGDAGIFALSREERFMSDFR